MTDIMGYNLAIIIKAQAIESLTTFQPIMTQLRFPKHSIQQFKLLKGRAICKKNKFYRRGQYV